jgi:SAM-dependent methyltransferase
MTIQALQEFIGKSMVSAAALTALAAVLDEKTSGNALDPDTAQRIAELLAVVGAADLLKDVGPSEALGALAQIRAMYLLDSKLMFEKTRTRKWDHVEPEILESVGDVARIVHAQTVTREIVPGCEGLAERFRAGAAMLDVGVGVGRSAIALAQMWPGLRIVGIDPWQRSLRLARENVDRAGLADRIELREQGIESFDDRAEYDYVYFANTFIPERFTRPGLKRALNALRPGGWISIGAANESAPAAPKALFRLRETQWGGPVWNSAQAESALAEAGFVEVRALPCPPMALVTWILGRRKAE